MAEGARARGGPPTPFWLNTAVDLALELTLDARDGRPRLARVTELVSEDDEPVRLAERWRAGATAAASADGIWLLPRRQERFAERGVAYAFRPGPSDADPAGR